MVQITGHLSNLPTNHWMILEQKKKTLTPCIYGQSVAKGQDGPR